MIGNWPPGYLDPVPAPEGRIRQRNDLIAQLAQVEQEWHRWARDTEARRRAAWIQYHDAHGWPDEDEEYKGRLLKHMP